MAQRLVRVLARGAAKCLIFQQRQQQLSKPIMNNLFKSSTRNYISDMQKWSIDSDILSLIRNEIQYELALSPPVQPVPEYNSFNIDERPGEQWIRLTKKFGENEEIKVEVTMFDESVPVNKNDKTSDEEKLHITLIVDVFKGEDGNVLEFICSAWPDSIEIDKVFTRGHDRIKDQPYNGPKFKELDDELQESLYDFLEERGIDDELSEFLHKHMMNKDRAEYIRWMENVKSFVQKK